jgi:hypothetical protein
MLQLAYAVPNEGCGSEGTVTIAKKNETAVHAQPNKVEVAIAVQVCRDQIGCVGAEDLVLNLGLKRAITVTQQNGNF